MKATSTTMLSPVVHRFPGVYSFAFPVHIWICSRTRTYAYHVDTCSRVCRETKFPPAPRYMRKYEGSQPKRRKTNSSAQLGPSCCWCCHCSRLRAKRTSKTVACNVRKCVRPSYECAFQCVREEQWERERHRYGERPHISTCVSIYGKETYAEDAIIMQAQMRKIWTSRAIRTASGSYLPEQAHTSLLQQRLEPNTFTFLKNRCCAHIWGAKRISCTNIYALLRVRL